MKADLIFFDNMYESANGTLRGLIGFISILILYKIFNTIDINLFKIDYKIVVTALILCCCLGVVKPPNKNTAIVLGGLIFFVFFSLIFIYSNIDKTYINSFVFILAGIIIGSISNYIIWVLYWNTSIRIKGSKFKYMSWHICNLLVFIYVSRYYKNN